MKKNWLENRKQKKKNLNYLSALESRKISHTNRKVTNAFERQHKRKNVPESEFLTQMKDPSNVVEFENLHSYFFHRHRCAQGGGRGIV